MPNFTPSTFRARAKMFVGLPYVLGAEFDSSYPSTAIPQALDCSELVETLYRENDTPIGDLAAAQFDKCVRATGDIQVGDLVFLRNNPDRWNKIGHVAVITAKLSNGDWEIVEAKGRAYGVVVSTLSYWQTRSGYTGIMRFPGFSLAPEQVLAEALSATTLRLPVLRPGMDGGQAGRKLKTWMKAWFPTYASEVGTSDGWIGGHGSDSWSALQQFARNTGLLGKDESLSVWGPKCWAEVLKLNPKF